MGTSDYVLNCVLYNSMYDNRIFLTSFNLFQDEKRRSQVNSPLSGAVRVVVSLAAAPWPTPPPRRRTPADDCSTWPPRRETPRPVNRDRAVDLKNR